jgi:hypothetical protein
LYDQSLRSEFAALCFTHSYLLRFSIRSHPRVEVHITYSTGVKSQPSSVIIVDFNNDTRLDIAVANYGSNNVALLVGNGNGSFVMEILYSAGFDSRPLALASGDVNKDNSSDIIAVNGYGNIEILLKLCSHDV